MDYSDYVRFIFEPDKFDYSKVDTADVMWCNFFNIDEYRNILLNIKVTIGMTIRKEEYNLALDHHLSIELYISIFLIRENW